MTLRATLEAAASEGRATAEVGADGSTSWSHAGQVFAVLDGDGRMAAFRLDPVLAGAARRTPDTHASDRGDAWVAFAPSVVDGHATDRAAAWFTAALRRAGGG